VGDRAAAELDVELPPITTCMIAASTREAISAPNTKVCSACHIGSENT
jgi:hypothetical protein